MLQGCVNDLATPIVISSDTSLPTASGQVIATAAISVEPPLPPVAPTRTARPTLTAAVKEELGLTAPLESPIALNDVYRRTLEDQGYKLVSAASTRSSSGAVYSAYLFQYDFDVTNPTDPVPANPCNLTVYRWDGKRSQRIFETSGPGYPSGGYFEPGRTPVYCDAYPFQVPTEPDAYQEAYLALSYDGYWSDINVNGLPEFHVDYWYCYNACGGYPEGATHFYEIRDADTVVDITEGLPGFIHWARVNTVAPITFYVDDPAHLYAPHDWIAVPWIYQWDRLGFVDVTLKFADKYIQEAEGIAAEWEGKYGQPFVNSQELLGLLKIPLLFEKAGKAKEGVDRFGALTMPVHWPGTEPLMECWLKVANEQFRADLESDQSLSLPMPVGLFMSIPLPESCEK